MKKVLIVINSMSYGGIQKALINLLQEISAKDEYEITLLMIRSKGAYIEQIPKGIKVLEANCFWKLLETSNAEIKRKNLFLWLVRGGLAVLTKNGHRKMAMRLLAASQKKIGKYDVAISFRHPDIEYNFLGGGNEFVLKCCAADEKITFIHGDYQKYGGNCKYNQEMLEQFDKIAAVSEGCMNSFLNTLPQMKNKTSCVYNCHNYKEICALAENDTVYYNHECSVFVTVCRLGAEKGLTRAINILAELKNRGMRFTWYIIGDGEEKEHIQKVIQEKDMCSDIILEGAQKNPYRYIKDADFFLLPSIHEAAPMVIGESLCLGVPVVSTATSSAQELIGVDGGIVCDNTEEAISEMLYSVLSGENKRLEECRKLLKSRVFNNKKALEQFERLLQGEEK